MARASSSRVDAPDDSENATGKGRRRASDPLGLARARSDRLAIAVVGVMVLLAALALAGGAAVLNQARHWQRAAAGLLLVQVPDPAAASPLGGSRLDAVLQGLRALPGVGRAAALPEARMQALLRPWLGEATGQLALPAMVEVTLAPPGPAPDALAAMLARAAPGAAAEPPDAQVARLLEFAQALVWLAGAVTLLVGVAAIAAVVMATRAALAAHAEALILLHHMGASDAYLARHFARRAGRLALLGALGGALLALPVLAGLGWLAAPLAGTPAGWALPPAHWLPPLLLPPVALLLARISAALSVRRWLRRL